jgi:hypothetical protein
MTAHFRVTRSATTYSTLPVVASWNPVTSGSRARSARVAGDASRESPLAIGLLLRIRAIVICFYLSSMMRITVACLRYNLEPGVMYDARTGFFAQDAGTHLMDVFSDVSGARR